MEVVDFEATQEPARDVLKRLVALSLNGRSNGYYWGRSNRYYWLLRCDASSPSWCFVNLFWATKPEQLLPAPPPALPREEGLQRWFTTDLSAAEEMRDKRKLAVDLVQSLHKQAWPGVTNFCIPPCWMFRFTPPMQALLDLGAAAQASLVEALKDVEIRDQAIILLGGVGDERVVAPIIEAMKSATSDPILDRRRRTLLAGNLALTNVTVADVIWHHGGGIPSPRCPDDPAKCWAKWWEQNAATFRVRDVRPSRRYTNYPNYGVYRGLP